MDVAIIFRDHLNCIANVQDETGGVTEVVRYSFVCGNMTIFDQVDLSVLAVFVAHFTLICSHLPTGHMKNPAGR